LISKAVRIHWRNHKILDLLLLKKKKFKKPNKANGRNQELKSFEKCIKELAPKWSDKSPEPLAQLDYENELDLKNKAFKNFLSSNGVSTEIKAILASPKPRHYRTTSKRRVFCTREGIGLGFSEQVKAGEVLKSDLEPTEHQEIYEQLHKLLSESSFNPLARSLNWLIIRGTYERRFLILNFFKMNSGLVRKIKQLSEKLQREKVVEGAMTYFDPSRSEYYLEAERPQKGIQTKHLFGPKLLGLKVNEVLMRYSPIGFSQINESMIPHMIEIAEDLLAPEESDSLLDLYCGYGLFSHTIAKQCKKVTGFELSKDAINSAREISKRLKTEHKMKFYSEKIDSRFVRDKLGEAVDELILLDPPRKGCEPGVISELAKRKPKRVLHIFCGTDVVPRELKQWKEDGYKPKTIQAIDMFPGTPNLETMVLLER